MNYDQLGFVNQQLASMLRDGIPLEGSLRQLCANMERGALRTELELLEKDLATGMPLGKALKHRTLPEFYTQMLQVGARGNDLPSILTLLADYYQNADALWTRLKGLMVYPVIVLGLSFAFSAWVAVLGHRLSIMLVNDRGLSSLGMLKPKAPPPDLSFQVYTWLPPVLLALVALPFVAGLSIPPLRRELRWRLPAFREAMRFSRPWLAGS